MPAMPPRVFSALLMAALAGASMAAQTDAAQIPAAQIPEVPGQLTLFRCGPQGQELRNTPCPQGPGASEVLRYDPGSPEAAAAARARALQEAKLNDRLSHEREARARAEREALERAPRGVTIGQVPAGVVASNAESAPGQPPAHRTAKSHRGKPGPKPPRTARRPPPSRDE